MALATPFVIWLSGFATHRVANITLQVSKLGAEDPWLVLDGAHTPDSAAVLARTLRRAFPKQPLALVIAMADDKDHSGVSSAS